MKILYFLFADAAAGEKHPARRRRLIKTGADYYLCISHDALDRRRCNPQATQTVYWILAASKGWIKQTYRKIMHTQNTQYTQNHITGNELVQIE